MCNAIRDGGQRCPVHQHHNIAAIKAASHLSGLTRLQTERLFAELRREGRNAEPLTNRLRAGSLRRIRNSVAGTDVAEAVESEIERSRQHDTEIDPASGYAQRALLTRSRERAAALNARFAEVATRTGYTQEEVAAKYKEFRNAVDTSRGSAVPAEYDQNTRRAAVLANLPYDRASVVAIEKLNTLAPAEEGRRVALRPAPEGSHINSYGYDEGRMEVVFNSNTDRIYAYQNVPAELWNRFSESESPGRIFAREIRGVGDYQYASEAAAEADAHRVRCGSCGQFRAAAHSCPEREQREEIATTLITAGQTPAEVATFIAENVETPEDIQNQAAATAAFEEYQNDLAAGVYEAYDAEVEPAPTAEEVAAEAETPVEDAQTTPAAEIPAYDLNATNGSAVTDQDTGYLNQVGVDNASDIVADHVATVENQREPAELSTEAISVGSEQGLERIQIANNMDSLNNNYYWNREELETHLGEETIAEIENAPEHIYYVVGVREAGGTPEVLASYDSRYYTGKSDSNWGDANTGYRMTYGYNVRRRGFKQPEQTFTEEERDALVETETTQLAALVESGQAVRIEGTTSETRKYVLDGNRTGNRDKPYLRMGNATAFKRAIRENKVVIMPVSVRHPYGVNSVDDQGFHVEARSNTEVTGEVAVRRNSEGVMEVISTERKLRCNCRDYRLKYYCQHVNYAQRHLANVAQQMIPVPRAAVPESERPHRLLTQALHDRADTRVVEPENEAPYISFGTELSGETRSGSYWQARNYGEVPVDLRPADPDNITPDEAANLQGFSASVGNITNFSVPVGPGQLRTALRRGDVEVPMSMNFGWRGSVVTGSLTFNQNSTPDLDDLTVRSRNLRCTCAAYQENYDCEHVRAAAAMGRPLLGIGSRTITSNTPNSLYVLENRYRNEMRAQAEVAGYMARGMSREQAQAEVAAELARRQAEQAEYEERRARERAEFEERQAASRRAEVERMRSMNADVIAGNETYRASMLARWENVEETYADNPKQFFDDYQDTLRRKRDGEEVIPFRTENVTDGICADEPGARAFGIELEFDIKRGVNKSEALRKIGQELHAAGLTTTSQQTRYHSARSSGWANWSFEQDCTVDAEIVSPLMKDTPEHWEQLRKVTEIVNRNGGIATTRTGSHVHVSTASYEMSSAKHAELLRTVNNNEDNLYRLAANPATGKHRGTRWCAPNATDTANDISDDVADGHQVLGYNHNSHGVGLNFEGTASTTYKKSNIEFRMWDGTMDPAVIQQQVAISAAITDYAERKVIVDKVSKKPAAGDRVTIGTSKRKEKAVLTAANTTTHTEETFKESSAQAAEFFDKLFRRKEDRAAAASLFAATNWQS
jgi:hypothetical protein